MSKSGIRYNGDADPQGWRRIIRLDGSTRWENVHGMKIEDIPTLPPRRELKEGKEHWYYHI